MENPGFDVDTVGVEVHFEDTPVIQAVIEGAGVVPWFQFSGGVVPPFADTGCGVVRATARIVRAVGSGR